MSAQDDGAARRLAEAEDRFRAAFEDAAIGMTLTSLDGRFTRVNRAFCVLLGRSEDELIGRPIRDFTHPDDIALTSEAIDLLRADGATTATHEQRYLRPDGTPVWVLCTASVVRRDGRPGSIISQAVDITERRAAEAALRASEERFRTLAAAAPNGIWATDRSGSCIYANQRLGTIVGMPAQHLLGFGWQGVLGDFADPAFARPFVEELQRHGSAVRELRIAVGAGEPRWVRVHAGLMQTAAGRTAGFVGSIEDVTAEVRNRQELAAREAELRLLAETSSDFLARLSPDLVVRYASAASEALLGYPPGELVGVRVDAAIAEEDRPQLAAALERVARHETATVVSRVRRRDGRLVWFESTLAPVLDPTGELIELVCVARDITERKAVELQLAHQAMHDALTGLPNRALFLDRLQHALARRTRGATDDLAVLFLDVDRFKIVNDSLGHEAGDRLLVDVSGRLDAALRPADTVARFGGDEFTVLCEGIAGELEAVAIAQRIVDLFDEPFAIEGREVFLSTSVGIALAGRHGELSRPDDLIRDADAAMYRAKERGKARYELFDAAMRDHAMRRLEVGNDLRRAVEREELRIHLQPEIDVHDGSVVGFEALLRWQHPERGLLSPADFVPLAEETGLIVPIGEWVLRRACEHAAAWRPDRLGISVNVSARQIAHGDLADVVGRTLAETGLRPGALCLELTESAVIDSGPTTHATLSALKELGVKLAIDDFGTGWSSLGHLRRFPLDVVKLDRSFISGLGREPQDASIAAAIISLAHALGLSTVAEGIETDEQLAVLASLGCDLGQGFLFARPAPLDAFATLLG